MTKRRGSSTAEMRSLTKWYAAARAALAHNRPLSSATDPARPRLSDLSKAEIEALRHVGAFKDESRIRPDRDPLLASHAQYMALLEESLSASQAAKLLRLDVSRIRQRLRERSLYGLEYDGSWRLPRFQFEGRLVMPGLAEVLATLPPELFPLDVVDFFLLPEPELQADRDKAAMSPREWLLAGRPIAEIVALARGLRRA